MRMRKSTVKGRPKVGSFYSFRVRHGSVLVAKSWNDHGRRWGKPWSATETIDKGQLIDIRSNGVLIFQQETLHSPYTLAERIAGNLHDTHEPRTKLIRVRRSMLVDELDPIPGRTPSNPIKMGGAS